MQKNYSFLFAIIKSACLTIMVLLCIMLIARQQTNEAVAVFNRTHGVINMTEENLVTIVKQHTNTDQLYKIKLTSGEIKIQLHFTDMLQLVQKLDGILNEYIAFYFNRVENVNQLTIFISEQATDNLIYRLTISKTDYLDGKELHLVPLP